MKRTDRSHLGAPTPPPRRWGWASLAGAIALVLLAVISGGAQAPDTATADALARRAAARIKALQREADSLASRERTLLEDLRKLAVERDLRAAELDQGARTLDRIQSAMAATATRIATLEQTAQSQLPDLSARMVDLYKIGNGGYLRLLLSVDDLRSMGRAYRFVSGLQRFDQQRVREHQRTLADLRKAQASLEERRVQAQDGHLAVARARDAAEQAVAAHEDMVRRIDARRDLAAQFMGELQAAQQKLQRTLDDAALGTPPAPGTELALPLRPFRGDLDWPVSGTVVGSFGRQVDRRFHTSVVSNGVRIAAGAATPVRAIHEGTVAYAESFPGFGKLVIVDHGAVAFSLYGYLADIDVTTGTRVSRGQPVGSVGTALDGTAALYFELRIDGKPVDPLQWLKRK
jgi:septal ring factor EnvC (AmiA/AmiB activator)